MSFPLSSVGSFFEVILLSDIFGSMGCLLWTHKVQMLVFGHRPPLKYLKSTNVTLE